MQDLLRILVSNAMNDVSKDLAVEKFLEVAAVQMKLDGSSDFIGAVSAVREKLGALALSVDESLYWLVYHYYGFGNKPLLLGVNLSNLSVLLSFVNSGICDKYLKRN